MPGSFQKRLRSTWRWSWRVGLGVSVLVVVIAVVWVETHRSPRHDYFTLPRAPIVKVVCERDEEAGSEGVELTMEDGFVVRLRVVRDFSNDAPRTVVVVVGGHRTGREAARLVGEPKGVAVVAVDYPYDGPDKIRGLRQATTYAPQIQRALLNTPRALSQALDWILTEPWADPAQVEIVGVSLGVPFVAVAGAIDTRFARVWIIQGGADNAAWIATNLERKIPQAWLRRPAAALVHRLAHGASFDTEFWLARVAPRPVIMIGAREDGKLPRAQVEQLFAAAGEPKELIWIDGDHVNPRRPETVRRVLDVVWPRL